jgi:hypothetical protein
MNDGVLELKTGTPAANTPKTLAHQHRRKISMNLPIKVQFFKHFVFMPLVLAPLTIIETFPSVPTFGERELEYKQCHTFIGTASLDDFLEILEHSSDHTITRPNVSKTFIILASTDSSLLANFCSWNRLGTCFTHHSGSSERPYRLFDPNSR